MGKTDRGEIGSYSDEGAMLSKSLIQFSVDVWGCVPSLLFDMKPDYGEGNEDDGNLIELIGVMETFAAAAEAVNNLYFSVVQFSAQSLQHYLLSSLSFLLKLFFKFWCYFIKIYMHIHQIVCHAVKNSHPLCICHHFLLLEQIFQLLLILLVSTGVSLSNMLILLS